MNKKQIAVCVIFPLIFAFCARFNVAGLRFSLFFNGVWWDFVTDRSAKTEWIIIAVLFASLLILFKSPNKKP